MATGGLVRAATVWLTVLNLALHTVVLALAGWAVNASMDGNPTRGMEFAKPQIPFCSAHSYVLTKFCWICTVVCTVSDTDATTYLTMLALIASGVGAASMVSAAYHCHSWSLQTYSASATVALAAAVLCLQSLGFASKGIDSRAFRCQQVKALEGLTIIVAGTQLFFVVILQYGKLIGEYA